MIQPKNTRNTKWGIKRWTKRTGYKCGRVLVSRSTRTLLKGETKALEATIATGGIFLRNKMISLSPLYVLGSIAVGTARNQRIGNKIMLKNVVYNYTLRAGNSCTCVACTTAYVYPDDNIDANAYQGAAVSASKTVPLNSYNPAEWYPYIDSYKWKLHSYLRPVCESNSEILWSKNVTHKFKVNKLVKYTDGGLITNWSSFIHQYPFIQWASDGTSDLNDFYFWNNVIGVKVYYSDS